MKLERVIREAKSFFGSDRTRLKEKVISDKEYKKWRKSLQKTTKQPFDIQHGISDSLVEGITNERFDEIDWHWIGDISWEFKILLNEGIDKGYDWDKKLALKCDGVARILQVYVSEILPCYTINTYAMAYSKKGGFYEFEPIEVNSGKEAKELNRINELLASRGYLFIKRKDALKKYKKLYSDCNRNGGASLFDVLFSDIMSYQAEYQRFSDGLVRDKTGKRIDWREYYTKEGKVLKRMEYRYFPSNNVLLTTTDGDGQIIEVKVWRNKGDELHKEFSLSIESA